MKELKLPWISTALLIVAAVFSSCSSSIEADEVASEADALAATTSYPTEKKAQSDLTALEQLGKEIFFDKISVPGSQACADCHSPSVGFSDPNPGTNKKGAVNRGAVPQRFGNRKPPSAAYATFSPVFHYDGGEELFEGGNFWDGRATGGHYAATTELSLLTTRGFNVSMLGLPSAEQALGPFLNPVEQNVASKEAVLTKIANAKYADLWAEVWGEPISLADEAAVLKNYDRIGLAVSAFEGSSEVNQFSSKYDLFLIGQAELTADEAWGLELFNGKAMCSACHPSGYDEDGEEIVDTHPLFTDFTFDNLGVPKNPENPMYDVDPAFIDFGLGGFLSFQPDPVWQLMAAENMGKQKVPTLRNVDKRPGNGFTKAYMHNGVFKSLEEVVHFYNTRDTEPWPAPEVPENVNVDELGNLGLTSDEELALVAFMKTLSDGYKK